MRIERQIELLFIGAVIWIGSYTTDLAGRIKRNERGDVPPFL